MGLCQSKWFCATFKDCGIPAQNQQKLFPGPQMMGNEKMVVVLPVWSLGCIIVWLDGNKSFGCVSVWIGCVSGWIGCVSGWIGCGCGVAWSLDGIAWLCVSKSKQVSRLIESQPPNSQCCPTKNVQRCSTNFKSSKQTPSIPMLILKELKQKKNQRQKTQILFGFVSFPASIWLLSLKGEVGQNLVKRVQNSQNKNRVSSDLP